MKGEYSPPVNTHFRQFHPEEKYLPHMGRIIGRQGRHFIRITKNANVEYIWYRDESKAVEIWGNEGNLKNGREKD